VNLSDCRLNGLIIKNDPKSVLIGTTVDATGTVIDAEIKQIGGIRIDTHNLEKPAKVAGILKPGEQTDIRELLAFSTFCIHWFGRYPFTVDSRARSTCLPGKEMARMICRRRTIIP